MIRSASAVHRLGIVSAHFPPNFVSGGTLVPQRLAQAFATKGWSVNVFTGWIGSDRPPLSTWDDVDDAGVRVRWLSTFHGWGDRQNFDHPAAVAAFASWLDKTTPELVHFHSLQTLGAGLVPEAVARGLPAVVTLHDFWWWCARQFLCNRDYQPCCLAVDAGTCPCQIDRAFLEDRNRFTGAALEHASQLIAVSDISARVALANGVDPSRLVVIENGVPFQKNSSARHSSADRLRFTYAGGPDRMKGVHFLLDAARHLTTESGWELTAYGCEEWAPLTAGLPVRFPPAYSPGELDQALEASDVVVIPSAMRESYSILTREALGAGVPVICSDSLGPEEVVEHDVNGLVVPSSDSAALAEAMRRVLHEPGLLDRLRAGCREVPLPEVAQQVAAHEEVYRRLLEPSQTRPDVEFRPGREIRRVLFVVGIDGAPLRYRAWLPAEGLEGLGIRADVRYYRHPDINLLGEQADVVVLYRVPATVQIQHFLAGVRRLDTPIVFDVDDLIFDPELADEIPALAILPPEEAALWLEGVTRYRTTMEMCDAFIGSTPLLCQHAEAVVGMPAFCFANGVGRQLGKLSDDALRSPRRPGPLRIGYLSGTTTHDHDWQSIEAAVIEVLECWPETELWLVGYLPAMPALDRFGARVIRRPLLPWTELPSLLRDLDVNLAPMQLPSRFNEAKSAIKWLEAALVETPTVASATAPFREAVDNGRNGFLASSHHEWVAALSGLVEDAALRRRLGARARRDALLEWAPARQGRRYLEILQSLEPRRTTDSTWTPVTKDEPSQPIELEPYPPPSRTEPAIPSSSTNLAARLPTAVRRRSRDFLHAVREQGLGAAVQRTVNFLRRRFTNR